MTAKSTTGDAVRASVITRPTGAAAAGRAASTLQSAVRSGLKRLALDADTTEPEAVASATLSSDFPPQRHAFGVRLGRRGARNG